MATKHTSICLKRAQDDEPIFVLKASDETAPATIRKWVKINRKNNTRQLKCYEALAIANDMELWHEGNKEVVLLRMRFPVRIIYYIFVLIKMLFRAIMSILKFADRYLPLLFTACAVWALHKSEVGYAIYALLFAASAGLMQIREAIQSKK